MGAARLRMATEEHGAGRQQLRFRVWPRPGRGVVLLAVLLATVAAAALNEGDERPAGLLLVVAIGLVVGALSEMGGAVAAARSAIDNGLTTEEDEHPKVARATVAQTSSAPIPLIEGVLHAVRPGEVTAVVPADDAVRRALSDVLAVLCEDDREDGRSTSLPTRQLGVMLSDPFMRPLTVAENIALNRPGASRREIEAAARIAGVHAALGGLPRAYDTMLSVACRSLRRGDLLRLAVARAILEDAPILVMGQPFGAKPAMCLLDALDGGAPAGVQRRLVVADRVADLADATVLRVGPGTALPAVDRVGAP